MQFWSGDSLAIEVSGPQGASETVVRQPYALIGMLAKADVRLAGEGIQKRAALLYAVDGKVMCRRLEAKLSDAYTELTRGEWLQFGEHRLRAHILPQGNGGVSTAAEQTRIPVLRVRHKNRTSVSRRLYRTLEMIGRGDDCELELRSTQVSLYHCALLRSGNRVWCLDLGSGNGTLLNGQPIGCALVELGGRLRIGDFELEFQRYSRRSAQSLVLDSQAGSDPHLAAPPIQAPRKAGELALLEVDLAEASDTDSGIATDSSLSHSSGSSLLALGAPSQRSSSGDVPLAARQSDLLTQLAILSTTIQRLRQDQEALATQLAEYKAESRLEFQQQLQSDRQSLIDEFQQRIGETQQTILKELADNLEPQKSLWQQLRSQLADLRSSEPQDLTALTESMQKLLSEELHRQQAEQATMLVARIAEARESVQLSLANELHKRLEDWLTLQSRQEQLQSESQRSSLLEELTTRLNALVHERWESTASADDIAGHSGSSDNHHLAIPSDRAPPAATDPEAITALFADHLQELKDDLADQLKTKLETQLHTATRELSARVEGLQATLKAQLAEHVKAAAAGLASQNAAVERLRAEQSEFAERLSAQREQIEALQSDQHDQRSPPHMEIEPSIPIGQIDWSPGDNQESVALEEVSLRSELVSPASDIPESVPFDSANEYLATGSSRLHITAERKSAGTIDEKDPLLHFVSDRLAEMDAGRHGWMIVYWVVAIGAVVFLSLGAWGLWSWLLGQAAT